MYGYCKNCGSPIEKLNEDLAVGSDVCDSRCYVEFLDRNFNGKDSIKDEINTMKRQFMDNLYSLCVAYLKNGKDIHLLIRCLGVRGFISKEDFVLLLEEDYNMKEYEKCVAFSSALNFQKMNPDTQLPEEHKIHLDADVESLDEVLTIIYQSNESFADLLPERSFIEESKIFPKFLI